MDAVDPEQGIDRISNLPDLILNLIISQLPVEEVVRTSVLAKRWRDTWKSVTCLDFNPMRMLRSCREFVDEGCPRFRPVLLTETSNIIKNVIHAMGLITTILQSHQNKVTNCRIVHFQINFYCQQVKEWVELLIKMKAVQALSLICEQMGSPFCIVPFSEVPAILDLPSGIFKSSTLRVLELTNYILIDVSPFRGCDNLRTLKLKLVSFNNYILAGITSCCQFLEELSLCSCQEFTEVEIRSRNLKFLRLEGLSLDKINIFAEALTVLILNTIACQPNCVLINAPRVTVFHAYCRSKNCISDRTECVRKYLQTEELLERCSGILVLSTSLDLNNIREAIILSYIFGVCSRLQKLDISTQVTDHANANRCSGSRLSYPEYLFWDKKESFDCISNNLRKVCIWDFRGKVLEIEFVKYLIARARKIEIITIQCDNKCTREEATAARSLLSLPRTSTCLKVSVLKSRHSPSTQFDDVIGCLPSTSL